MPKIERPRRPGTTPIPTIPIVVEQAGKIPETSLETQPHRDYTDFDPNSKHATNNFKRPTSHTEISPWRMSGLLKL